MLGELLPQGGDVLAVALVLLDQQVLEPLVLRLELRKTALQLLNPLASLLGRLLKSLLTLLLLDSEAGAGSRVSPTLILFGSDARCLLKVQLGVRLAESSSDFRFVPWGPGVG